MNPTKRMLLSLAATFAVTLMPIAAHAQDTMTAKAVEAVAAKAPAPVFAWTDDELARIGQALVGTWRTQLPVTQGDDATKSTDMFVAVAPVVIDGLPNALYAESGRLDAMWSPSRQTIWQLYRHKGQIRLRTFEFRLPNGVQQGAIGAWAAPEVFPKDFPHRNLIGTLDLAVSSSGMGFSASTPYPYPTGLANAVEMTSQMTVSGDVMTTADRGFGADGSQVWGPAEGQSYTFTKFKPEIAIRNENGLVVINYTNRDGEAGEMGGRMSVNYTGAVTDGTVFDTSIGRAPFTFTLGQGVIEGFSKAAIGLHKGDHVRVFIPPEMGYGAAGRPRNKIPPNATLTYDLDVLAVEAPGSTPPPQPTPPTPVGKDPGIKIEPMDGPPPFVPKNPK